MGSASELPASPTQDWKAITPSAVLRAVTHIRDQFEERAFWARYHTEKQCFKALHPLSSSLTEPAIFKLYFYECVGKLQAAVLDSFTRLLKISLAHAGAHGHDPVEWAELHVKNLIEREARLVEGWIKSACDEHKYDPAEEARELIFWTAWRAPRWIHMVPNGNTSYDTSTAWVREDEESTKRILKALSEDRWVLSLESTLKDSVGKACETLAQQDGADEDCKFARLAIDEARKSVSEPDGRVHPKVGAVVVKNGQVLSAAHRGEDPGNHAEYVALEKRLSDAAAAGATLYTTLEPCTTRTYPKIPCATRIIERRIARVVVGMLDPDRRITGLGQRKLREAKIAVDSFPPDLADEVEELNREFTRHYGMHSAERASRSADDVPERLRRFATEKQVVLVEPVTPAFENLQFQVCEPGPDRIMLLRLGSAQRVGIPVGRVSEVLWAEPSRAPTLVLNGRLQWITIPNEWRFLPEPPLPSVDGYLGHARTVAGLQDTYVREIVPQLQQAFYEVRWFRRENLPTGRDPDVRTWQPFYGEDGRYLVCSNGREVLILAVRWNFSG